MKPFLPPAALAALLTGLLLAACSTPKSLPAEPGPGVGPGGATASAVPARTDVAGPRVADAPAPDAHVANAHVADAHVAYSVVALRKAEAADRAMGGTRRERQAQPVAPAPQGALASPVAETWAPPPAEEREKYQRLDDNPVKVAAKDPLSTLSLDVDTGSYSNVRRFLGDGRLPPRDAVRVEELVNYFPYSYPAPVAGHPFSVGTEVTRAPWNPQHLLLRVGVKAVERNVAAMPPANLVFLVDVSGSMQSPDKLPLVQATLQLLVQQLRPQDRVALVVYAGRTAVELPSTPGSEKEKIRAAIARLTAGGATAGEAALRLAYAEARAGFIKGGINRILLATDGDFNVGVSDTDQIKDIVARERESGISLTTLGFGTGNYQEALMEQIADVGNGNYSYIDSLDEGRKVLVEELSSTFNTVAKDVKIQVEFNPALVAEWRLVGYENRVLREEDFRNDKVDAAEVGAGKSVTALYEITPVGAPPLHAERRYGDKAATALPARGTELGYLRVRYKQPEGERGIELGQAIAPPAAATLSGPASADLRFAAAVAGFGQLLRQSPYMGTFAYEDVRRLAEGALDNNDKGWRREFLRLVELAEALTPRTPVPPEPTQERTPDHGQQHPGNGRR